MLIKLGIENFKAFGKLQEIDLRNLTVLSGLNSSGKSSVYQVLLLLKQSLKSSHNNLFFNIPKLDLNAEYLQIGQKKELLHDINKNYIRFIFHDDSGCILELSFVLHNEESLEEFLLQKYCYTMPHNEGQESNISLTLDITSMKWQVEAKNALTLADIAVDKQLDEIIRTLLKENFSKNCENKMEDDQKEKIISEIKKRNIYKESVSLSPVDKIQFIKMTPIVMSAPIDNYYNILADDIQNILGNKNFLKKLLKENDIKFEKLDVRGDSASFSSLAINLFLEELIIEIPPFRGLPQRVYQNSMHLSPLKGFSENKSLKVPYRFNFTNNKPIEDTLETALNYWVVDFFGLAEKVTFHELVAGVASEISLRISGREIFINNMGFGISQILPVIYKILSFKSKMFFVIDEPEIHLHPSMQSKLADFFYEMALVGKSMLIETHSEPLLNKLIFLLIKYKQKSNEVAMLWIERKNNEAEVREIQFDDLGYLIDAPEGFLDEKKKITEELTEIRLTKLNDSE
ncbi:MAG: DUF3696 domain-containing protein [Oligoflexales bacterium]|nr:DUF3696 domain-containing protein [Oligoflexales bacterium]